jgi:hypothetical protein
MRVIDTQCTSTQCGLGFPISWTAVVNFLDSFEDQLARTWKTGCVWHVHISNIEAIKVMGVMG